MNLIRLFTRWREGPIAASATETAAASQAVAAAAAAAGPDQGTNVFPLRSQAEWAFGPEALVESSAAPEPATAGATPSPVRPAGLLAAPELRACLGRDHYASGRHHGSVFRSLEALELGREAIVTSFQNAAAALAERLHARLDKLMLERQKIEGLSADMAGTLRLASEQLRREIELLHLQIGFAEQRKGWVLDALNRYQLGFDRGVRDALAYELLAS